MNDSSSAYSTRAGRSQPPIREGFCGACAAIPMAFAGAGMAGAGAYQKGQYKQRKKWMMIIGVAVSVISIAVAVYYLRSCKQCKAA